MRVPLIRFGQPHVTFERLATRWTVRYGLALVAIAFPCGLALFFKHLGPGAYLIMLLGAVLVAGVLGGLGPGLLATGLAAIVGNQVPLQMLSLNELHLLVAEGTLVSLGGALRAGLLKAHLRYESGLELEQQILEISEDERRRIGHDLHDRLGQHLTGISLLSEMESQQLSNGGKPDPARIEKITRLVSEAVSITRDLAKSLSPITLELDGLPTAVAELAETSSTLLGIRCVCEYQDQDQDQGQDHALTELDKARSLHLFRVIQEAVNNSVKHGKARNVRIGLSRNQASLIVTVVDDGVGLSEKTRGHPGIGLRIMQHRARMLNATLTIERASSQGGTVVTCVCPIQPLEVQN